MGIILRKRVGVCVNGRASLGGVWVLEFLV